MHLTINVAILQILMPMLQHPQGMTVDPCHLREQATLNKDLSMLKSVGRSMAATHRMIDHGR